ncbi:MAG: SapC family protein [Desulfuromonas sp.]|nr:SapC family protein [Desulfuromonas sp.]
MSNITLITKKKFENKRWKRSSGYAFAATDHFAPLVLQELPRAALVLPIGFIQQKDHYFIAAIQGLAPNQNLLLRPDGKWLVSYVPAVYRSYPFNLGQDEKGQQHLCIDTDSGVVNDTDGELFFTENGEVSDAIKQIYSFLHQIHQSRKVTTKICAILQQHDLFEPWPLTMKTSDGDKLVQGIHRINEKRLNALDSETFELVRQAGGLPLIYCHLLSMQHISNLVQLAAKLQPKAAAETGGLDIEKLFGAEDDIFHFS